ncbi:MAG: enoyl-CoA hydratase/isomerase family protein [Candidatus Riflebacteria bacterium]|nr:enoyl-CoA hydratase/isomerase family protein [Candidatus Riflebacteria bacterium]
MPTPYRLLVGVDWATQEHQICAINPDGHVLDERRVEHCGSAILGSADWLAQRADGDTGSVALAIEIPREALVETLIERGFHVYAINPKQLDRFRDRHTVAGAKDDRRDAFVLADSLRTDPHCFRLIHMDDAVTIELRELARVDDDLREETNRLTNRLREQIHRYYPQPLKLSPSADEPWLRDLWELLPEPAKLSGVRRPQVERILRPNRIRRIDSETVLQVLKVPPLYAAPGTVEAAKAHIQLLLPRLRLVYRQRRTCARRIEGLLDQLPHAQAENGQKEEHRDVALLRSLPGAGRVVCATAFAEASPPLRERDYHSFRALAGVAPVTKQTGKQGKEGSRRRVTVLMRRACAGAPSLDPAWGLVYTGRALEGRLDGGLRSGRLPTGRGDAGPRQRPARAHDPAGPSWSCDVSSSMTVWRAAMSYENLTVEVKDRIATVTVNRPKVLNALNTRTLEELGAAFASLSADTSVRAIILTGAGEKAFVAGADISEMKDMDPPTVMNYSQLGTRVLMTIERCSKPTIAAVNGFALGGGMELAMACDIIYASEKAKFGQPEINLGVTPGFGGTQRLPRLIGKAAALELLLTGDTITAQQARELGLVSRVVAPEALLPAAQETASRIAAKGAFALSQLKRAVINGLEMPLEAALVYESHLFGLCFATPDQKEGMTAFVEKRKPSFQ